MRIRFLMFLTHLGRFKKFSFTSTYFSDWPEIGFRLLFWGIFFDFFCKIPYMAARNDKGVPEKLRNVREITVRRKMAELCAFEFGLFSKYLKSKSRKNVQKIDFLKHQNAHYGRFFGQFGVSKCIKINFNLLHLNGWIKTRPLIPISREKSVIAESKRLKKLVSWGSCFFLSNFSISHFFRLRQKSIKNYYIIFGA